MSDKTTEDTPVLLRIEEVADLLTISESTVRRLVRFGDMKPPIKIHDGSTRFVLSEIEEFIRTRPRVGGTGTAAPKKKKNRFLRNRGKVSS